LSGSDAGLTGATCHIDGFGPLPVVAPASTAELIDIVRHTGSEGQAIYPIGGRTTLDFGLPPSRPGVAVALQRLNQVVDYPARDMTITVQAGIRVGDLQRLLAKEQQRLPIDVPRADQATLGGILSTNTTGPRRYGYGTLRDYVIGISAVNDLGEEIKAGGRVVKNVAGYDLCKLFIGSLGTLGIITQVTLKLRPRPAESALVILTCSEDGLDALVDKLHASQTRPVIVELLNPAAVGVLNRHGGAELAEGTWTVIGGYEDNAAVIQWQVQQLIKEVRLAYPLEARVGEPALPLDQALVEFPHNDDGGLNFQAALLPSATADFCRRVSALPEAPALQAHAGNGIVIGHVGAGLTKEPAAAMLKRLRELATAGQGHVVVRRCPPAWKDAAFVWGPPRGDYGLMRKVKEQLDPQRLFNPGRFVDGI
jgi:glycolate oxidase FAD binding subunit